MIERDLPPIADNVPPQRRPLIATPDDYVPGLLATNQPDVPHPQSEEVLQAGDSSPPHELDEEPSWAVVRAARTCLI